jgi:membrane protein
VFGVLLWIVASAAFFVYVSNFSSYGATYGAFAGAVILLVWLYLSSSVLLLGAELNAVIEVRRTPQLSETYEGPPLPTKAAADD